MWERYGGEGFADGAVTMPLPCCWGAAAGREVAVWLPSVLASACSAPSRWPREAPCGDAADAKVANSDMIQAGHIWFLHLAVCFWVLGLPLF